MKLRQLGLFYRVLTVFEVESSKLELSVRNMPIEWKMYVVVIWGRTSVWL